MTKISEELRTKLDTADWEDIVPRVGIYALKLLNRRGLPPSQAEDFVNEAIKRTYAGDRVWKPDKIALLVFLCGVVRSLVSDECARRARENPRELTPNIGATSPDAEEQMILQSRVENTMQIIKERNPELLAFFAEVNEHIFLTGQKKDTEIEIAKGWKPKTISEKRRQLKRLIQAWKRQERRDDNPIATEKLP